MITLVDVLKVITDHIIGLDKIDQETKEKYLAIIIEAAAKGMAEGVADKAKENMR